MRQPQPRANIVKSCYFCVNGFDGIDFKDTALLRRFTSSYAKIMPRRRSGVCAFHQRKMANAIKQARIMALMPFIRI